MVVGAENVVYFNRLREEDKPPTPTNEFGIVIPPPMRDCMEEACIFRGDNHNCDPTCHHLHSTSLLYNTDGRKARRFRELEVMTVWMPECQHKDQHDRYKVTVPIPSLEVMKQCTREARWLKRLDTNRKVTGAARREMLHNEYLGLSTAGLMDRIDDLLDERDEYLERVGSIEVIPEELVTGALLVAAPEAAQRRISSGSGFVLTGTIAKEEIPLALEVARGAEQLAA